MSTNTKYEAVIGLEIHTQLKTKTKAYSGDEYIFGAKPNTKTSIITLGHPGTLPRSNKKVVEYAVKFGLAIGGKIRKINQYARKNYFYPDLPKGYQITQDTTPICNGGNIMIKDKNGKKKKINITRLHMEEDAGKNIHDIDPFNSLVDLNRAGVPLIELVTEPEISTADEAYQFVSEVRKLVKYLDISNGNMEEGSLRCDANISIRKKGDIKFGTKVEIKNMNSINNIKRAINFEIKRQTDLLINNQKIKHETRSYDAVSNITISMRHKEKANDYRYFPEPDLLPIKISKEDIERIKKNLPPLPNELQNKFLNNFKLNEYDTNVLIEDKNIALYFNELCEYTNNYKQAANFINGTVKSYLNENAISIKKLNINPKRISTIINLISNGKISNSIASNKIFPKMLKDTKTANEIAIENNWIKENDTDIIHNYIQQAISKYPEKKVEYQNGKKGLLGLFMGEVMKLSKGKADPKLANKLLILELEK
ncbi:MAG: Asp-tRNA(Asn)/Glu-tRNA(Gln) amidotransferase GatCAB subunit B [Flavobacteriales bacterium]|nr:Asp-tRNA(Asn)/Glu-tRNA(Gln) amidotransferase GatCAB subunit B [Flavobacteriales bacterium]|tara:strand:+ start:16805 stop:18253 length:1449 start_codon:yes stop_codon:yes gene_type:complete